jgi:DMSO reductase anchor subunit
VRPSASVLLLTTLTGGGYGLLAWIGAGAALQLLPASRPLALGGIALALALASAGLLASTFHLGRPERAWRAFSQWRSSWLSREGVASVLAYPVTIAFAIAVYQHPHGIPARVLGAAAALASAGTVFCTAMIYASLKPIRQWHNPHTAPGYLIHAVFSGAVLLALLSTAVLGVPGTAAAAAAVSAAVALAAKALYWRHIDRQSPLATLAHAIGLPRDTEVKPLDAPHFTENYILREMGFAVARRHAARLRRLAVALAFALPAALSILAGLRVMPLALTSAAAACALLGLLTERWLFFAEATHVSALYYGRPV